MPVASLASPSRVSSALAGEKRDLLVKHALEASLSPISFAEGRLEVALAPNANPDIIQTLSARLKLWTGRQWMVTVNTDAPAAPTIRDLENQRKEQEKAEAHADPLVQAVLETFPGAKVVNVKLREEPQPTAIPTDSEAEEDDE